MDKPATPLPWAYRPQEHDDWGIIRMSGRDEDGFMRVVCRVNYVASPEELSAHRMAGTDPAGQDAAYILTACNAYPHLTAINAELVDALEGLATKLTEIFDHPEYEAVFLTAQIRRGPYEGPNCSEELAAAYTALARAKENSNGH